MCWEIKDATTQRELLPESLGALRETQKLTNGYYDLLVEDKWDLYLYEFHGGKYENTTCYGRANGLGSRAILTSCTNTTGTTPKASEVQQTSDTNGSGTGNVNGYSPGFNGNESGGVYRVGGPVSAPVPIYTPDAEFSDGRDGQSTREPA